MRYLEQFLNSQKKEDSYSQEPSKPSKPLESNKKPGFEGFEGESKEVLQNFHTPGLDTPSLPFDVGGAFDPDEARRYALTSSEGDRDFLLRCADAATPRKKVPA